MATRDPENRETLRDKFANTAFANLSRGHVAGRNHWNVIAISSYAAADAMMKERARRAKERASR